jgi:hypothetical protein
MNEIPRVEAEDRRELARGARDLLNDPAFKAACALLRTQWYHELIDSKVDWERLTELRAKLQVLEAIPAMIQKLITDETMAQRAGHGRRY